jgi:hypothetical protein
VPQAHVVCSSLTPARLRFSERDGLVKTKDVKGKVFIHELMTGHAE